MKKPDGQRSQMLRRVRKDSITEKDASLASVFIDRCLTALSSGTPSRVDQFKIANDIVEHTVYGKALSDFMLPAIKHLRLVDTASPNIRVYSVDGGACDAKLPDPFWSWGELDAQGYIQGFNSEEVVAQYDAFTSTFRIFDRRGGIAVHWARDMSNVPYWERSFPLRTLINWWHGYSALQPVHAAAVGCNGKAALLTAKGGSGKSTTALKCLMAGMQYLGDDFVLVDTEKCIVHSLYNVVKLTEDDFRNFPELKTESAPGAIEDQDKVQVFLDEKYSEQITSCMPLSLILVPRVIEGPDTYLSEISFEEVMEALTTSTLYLLRGASSGALHKIKSLVNSLPAYYLNLGEDIEASPNVIRKLLTTI